MVFSFKSETRLEQYPILRNLKPLFPTEGMVLTDTGDI